MLNSDIRDQAYQFFIEEAPELLEAIESGLLSLRQDRSTAKVHEIMRAAHSLKGGSASVGLEVIKEISHRLETIFKALYDESVVIDGTLENQLLQAYDCLRLPLIQEIETGQCDAEALQAAEPIFQALEEQLGDALLQTDSYIPSSSELGIDMVASIFEIDVAQGIDRLNLVLQQPDLYPIAGELQAQAEVFIGLAELLNLPGFGAIAEKALLALECNPEQSFQILQLALNDFEAGRQAVLAGDRTQGGSPSAELLALNQPVSNFLSAEPATFQFNQLGDPWEESALTESFLPNEALTDAEGLAELFLPDEAEAMHAGLAELLDPLETFDFQGSDELLTPLAASNELLSAQLEQSDELGYATLDLNDVFSASLLELDQEVLPVSEENNADRFGLEEAAEPEVVEPSGISELPSISELPLTEVVHSPADLNWLMAAASADHQEDGEIEVDRILVEAVSDAILAPAIQEEPEQLLIESPASLEEMIQTAATLFEQLPAIEPEPPVPANPQLETPAPEESSTWKQYLRADSAGSSAKAAPAPAASLSVRVDLDRVERMNNLVGELAISRNSLSLQNDQLQGSVHDLVERFERFQGLIGQLQDLSDQMLVTPVSRAASRSGLTMATGSATLGAGATLLTSFDALEMDRYSVLHFQLQEIFEQVMQLEESLSDIGLFAGQSNQTLGQQLQKLTQLQNELMWARMLPLGNVLNRFPRTLRELANKYGKSVDLKISGASVLVDKVVLEKLYDPLLHLLRNAFDHGIEQPDVRQAKGKPSQGTIEIRAFHRGNQTLIELIDDGKGLNLPRIKQRAMELGWISPADLEQLKPAQLLNFIFEPGFSTASQVSELSGRGVGLDVVRAQLRSLKGSVSVHSIPGKGTTFTLSIPLTLTVAKLLTCMVGTTALAVPSDSVEEILVPKAGQVKQSGAQQFLAWRDQLVPIYRVGELLDYRCVVAESSTNDALMTATAPKEWALPLLVIQREQHSFALEIDRLITEQELVIKPFGGAIQPPIYTYGCTILGDGSLVPVIDAATLVDVMLEPTTSAETAVNYGPRMVPAQSGPPVVAQSQAKTVLVVDDSAALRRMLALTLEKDGYRVIQARDGQEALSHLQQGSSVQLVICDIEMPNMNGFEFLSQRRQNPEISAIPVVMLTSRNNDKHRRLATHLGATAYFSKPYIEQDLLTALKNLLKQSEAISRT
jgi:two-component system, chemotaxis family, sensor histidine kinase and response regulator PixL